MARTTLGIDPDTKDLSVASWDNDGPGGAFVIHAYGRGPGEQSQVRMARLLASSNPGILFDGPYAIAIEGQQIDARKARTRDLFTLAHVTGAAIAWSVQQFPNAKILVPTPSEWKGGVAKHAMQARLYVDLGWGYALHGAGTARYAAPLNVPGPFQHIIHTQWRHVGDALLLARWAYNTSK